MKFDGIIEPLTEEMPGLKNIQKQITDNMLEAFDEEYATDEEMEQKGWEILKNYGIDREQFHVSQLKHIDFESMDYLSKKAVAIATKTNMVI